MPRGAVRRQIRPQRVLSIEPKSEHSVRGSVAIGHGDDGGDGGGIDDWQPYVHSSAPC
jgi:hypothetical protein